MKKRSSLSRRLCATVCAALSVGSVPPATAQGVDRQARLWAAACAVCHSAEGRAQSAIPAIAGRDAEVLYRTLLEFKNNQRPAATVMHQLSKGYADVELRRVAQYLAAQPLP
jgi:sulfide dehydrogenase cytochrome subunit